MQRFEVLGVRLSRFVCLGAAALLAASLAAPRPAHATKSWTGSGGNANWSNNNNWNSNGGPPTTDGTGTADFVATNAGGRYTVSVNENTNCALQFDSGGTNGYTLNIGSNTMNFVNTATGADGSQIGVDTALTETLNGGTVNIADNITSDVVAGGMLAINGTITGDNNISMSGAGTVNISGATTSGWGDFNGGFGGTNAGAIIKGGTFAMGDESVQFIDFYNDGVTLEMQASTSKTSNIYVEHNGYLNVAAATLTLGSGVTFDIISGKTLTIEAATNTNNVNFSAATVKGAGNVTVQSGRLEIENTNDVPTGTVTVGSGGTIWFLSNNPGNTYTNISSISGNGTATGASYEALSFQSGSLATLSHALTLAGNATIGSGDTSGGTISGAISGGYYLEIIGDATGGKVCLTNASNSYTGGTIVDAGTNHANIPGNLALGAASVLPDGYAVTINNGGTIDMTSFSQTIGALSSTSGGTLTSSTGSPTLTVQGGGTFGGVLSGGLLLTVNGPGNTLTLQGVNTYTGSTAISGGTLAIGGAGSLGSGAYSAAISNGGALQYGSSAAQTLSGIISGAAALTVSAGTLTLSGTNTYTGATAVTAGVLQLGGTGGLGTGSSHTSGVTVNNGAALNLNGFSPAAAATLNLNGSASSTLGAVTNSAATAATYGGPVTLQSASAIGGAGNITLNNTISGGFGLTKVGTDLLILSGASNGSTTTTISAGTLQIGANGTSGALGSSTISDSGTLVIDRGNAFSIASGNAISGTGGLIQAGSGTTTVNSANTYTGATAVTAGILQLGVAGALGNGTNNSSAVTVANGAALDLNGITPTAGSVPLNLNGTTATAAVGALTNSNATAATYGGPVTLQSASSIGGAGNITLSSTIGGGFALTKVGTDTLILSGGSNGSTTTTITAGTLQIGANGGSGKLGSGSVTDSSALVFNRTDNYGGTLTNSISGAGSLSVSAGTLTVGGANTYTGATNVNGGVLQLGVTGALGNGTNNTSAVTVANGAALDINGITPTAGSVPLNLNGTTATATVGALTNSNSTAATYGGPVTLQSASSIGGAGNITLSSTISGGIGLTKVGPDTLILTGGSNGSTTTTISGGTLQIGNNGGSGSLGSGNVTDNGVLVFNRNDNYGSALANSISGAGSLTLSAGTLALGGVNTYNGTTAINGGTLRINTASALANAPLAITSGLLDLTAKAPASMSVGPISMTGGALSFGVSGVISDTLVSSGAVSLAGTLNISAYGAPVVGTTYTLISGSSVSGGLTLGNVPAAGFNTWTPGIGVGGTTYTVSLTGAPVPTAAYWSSAVSTVWNDASKAPTTSNWATDVSGETDTMQLPGAVTDVYLAASVASSLSTTLGTDFSIHSLNMPATTTAPASIGGSNMLQIGAGGINLQAGAGGLTINTTSLVFGAPQTWTNNAVNPLTVNSAVSGSGLTTAGSGTIVLGSANTITGGVTINNSSVLQLGNSGALNSSSPNAVAFGPFSNGTLQLAGNSVTVAGLSTDPTNPGSAVVQNASGTPVTLTVSPASGSTFAGVIQDGNGGGPLSLVMAGGGVQTLAGSSTYSGGTSIQSGTLALSVANALPTSGAITITGGVLDLGGLSQATTATVSFQGGTVQNGALCNNTTNYDAQAGTVSASLNGSVALVKSTSGTVALTGSNNYGGGTSINGGVLQIAGDASLGAVPASPATNITLNNGQLMTAASTVSLSGSRNLSISNTGYLDAAAGLNMTVNGQISGTGSLGITWDGGVVTLAGSNSYQGNTLVGAAGNYSWSNSAATPTLQLANPAALPATTSVVFGTLAGFPSNTATLDLNGQNATIAGLTGGSNAVVENLSPSTTATLTVGYGDTTSSFAGLIYSSSSSGGGVALTKIGSGILTLAHTNTYSGATNVTSGTLALNDGYSGSDRPASVINAGTVTVGPGAVLALLANEQFGSHNTAVITLNGGTLTTANNTNNYLKNPILENGGSIELGSGGKTYSSATNVQWIYATGITSVASSAVNTVTSAGGFITQYGNFAVSVDRGTATPADLVISAPIQDYTGIGPASLTKTGLGILLLSASNTYSNGTTISAGTVQLGNASALGTGGLTANNGVLDLNANSIGVTSLGGSAGLITDNSNVTPGTTLVTVNQTGSTTFGGTIADGPNNRLLALTKAGTGMLTLSGGNNYNGGTLIQNGTLALGAVNALPTTGAITITGGVLDLGGLSQTTTATVSFQGGTVQDGALVNNTTNYDAQAGTISASLQGSVGLVKSTATTVILSGANTYSGVTDISAGTLNVGSLSDYGVAGGLGDRSASSESATGDGIGIHIGNVTTGATLQYTGSTAQSTDRQIRLSAANNTIDASGSLPTATMSFTYSGTNTNLFDNVGARTLTLTGSNAGQNVFAIGLTDDASNPTSLTKTGPGAWVLTGSNTYSGTTTISGGTLQIGDGTTDGSIGSSGNIVDNAVLLYNLVGTQAYANAISGSGSLRKQGGGTLTLSATNNTYNGGTSINAGTLTVTNSAAPGTGTVTVNGGTLKVESTMPDKFVVSATGGTITSTGTFVIGGNNANAINGPVTFSGGHIVIDSSSATTGSGAVNITGGIVQIKDQSMLSSGSISINGGDLWISSNDQTLANNFTIAGNGSDNTGAIRFESDGGTLNGTVTLSNNARITANNGIGTIDGAISGNYQLEITQTGTGSSGYVILNHANSYTGGTLIDESNAGGSGVLQLGASNAIPYDTALTLGNSGELDLHGISPTVSGLNTTLGGGTIGNSSTSNASTLIFAGSGAASTFGGTIQNTLTLATAGNKTVALSVTGGMLTLNGVNTYSGSTVVSGGVLAAGAGNALSAKSAVTLSGGTLDVSAYANTVASLNISTSGSGLNLGLGNKLTSSGAATLNGNLNVSGVGTAASYPLLSSTTSVTGQFVSATLDPNYGVQYSTTAVNALHKAQVANLTVSAVNPTVITGGTTNLIVSLSNSAPLNSDALSFMASASGSGYGANISGSVLANSSSSYTVSDGFDSSSLAGGASYTGVITVTGTNSALTTPALNSGATQSVTVTVLNHADPLYTPTTLDLGTVHAGYTGPINSAASIVVTNGNPGDLRAGLYGSGSGSYNVSLTPLVGVQPDGSTGTVQAMLANGTAGGTSLNQSVNYTFADASSLPGASSNVSTVPISVTGQVYSGQMVWSGAGDGSSWGSGGNWNDTQGPSPTAVHAAPGLDPGFTTVDSATFDDSTGTGGTVNLNGQSPSLQALAFSTTSGASYNLAQGSGGTLTLNAGGGVATISVTGNHTISAPINLSSNASVSTSGGSDMLTICGVIGGSGGLAMNGAGFLLVSGANAYGGGTSVSNGTLQVGNLAALGTGGLTADAGVVDLNGYGISIPTLNGAAGLITDNSGSGSVTTLTVTNSGNFGGTLADGSGQQLALVLDGPGTLILSGTGAFNGGTTVDSGILELASPTALADGSSLTVGEADGGGGFVLDRGLARSSFAAGVSLPAGSPAPAFTAVPEPGTLALLAAALWSAAACRRFRRRKTLGLSVPFHK